MTLTNLGGSLNHLVDLDLLDSNSVIIDAGSAVGDFIEKIRTVVNCRILAIECSRKNLNILKSKNFENIDIIEKALVGSNKEVYLTEFIGQPKKNGLHKYYQWNNIYGNHININKKYQVEISQYQVETITLPEIIEEYKLQSIDYLKLDVEGAERGVFSFLSKDYAKIIKQISLETHVKNRKEKVLIMKALKSLGFSVQEFPHNELYARQIN